MAVVARLPRAAWLERADLAVLVDALGAANMRYVGGAVRDTLLALAVSDIDIATVLTPDAVIATCAAAGIATVPTGIAHGTVTAVLPGGPVEITTLRRDVATDGRRATVAFSDDWRTDASRRDFTINALYAAPDSHEITDFFGGVADLREGRVRFIGAARERIAEDHLRILRYFRFAARFGPKGRQFAGDAEAEAACRDCAAMLKGLSRERGGQELLKLLGLPDPGPSVARMAGLGVLAVVLPEAGPEGLAALIAAEAEAGAVGDALRRLAALLPAEPSIAEAVAARLRLSAAARRRLVVAAGRVGSDAARARALAYRVGRQGAEDRLLLAGAGLGALSGWVVPEFPLKGRDVLAHGVAAGPQVAAVLQAVESRWVAEGFPGAGRVAEMLSDAIKEFSTRRAEPPLPPLTSGEGL